MNTLKRLKKYLDYKGINNKNFEEKVGFSNGAFASQLKNNRTIGVDKLENILTKYPEINPDWLLTGNGNMLREADSLTSKSKHDYNIKKTPLIPAHTITNWDNKNTTNITGLKTKFYDVPNFNKTEVDFMIEITGIGMHPTYSSGDLMACKKLPLNTFFQWNKVYVINTVQGAIIKRIKKSETPDHILCVSDNNDYDSFDLHVSEINSLSIVLGVIKML